MSKNRHKNEIQQKVRKYKENRKLEIKQNERKKEIRKKYLNKKMNERNIT